MKQMNAYFFLVQFDESCTGLCHNSLTLSHPVRQSPPAVQTWLWLALVLHMNYLEPDETDTQTSFNAIVFVIPANGSFGIQCFSLF